MCTMTWMFGDNNYELFFNRDEMRTRMVAFPPKIHVHEGTSFIAPIDADAGGTWMGVNDFGITVCLLNGYGEIDPGRTDYTSRGALVMSLLDSGNSDVVDQRLHAADLTAYRPFSLLVFEAGVPIVARLWDGLSLRLEKTVPCPLVSLSFRFSDGSASRKELFDHLTVYNAETLADFHCSHLPDKGPLSVCMHRDDAQTVSLSRVVVTEADVHYYYAAGPPCKTDFSQPVSFRRRSTGS